MEPVINTKEEMDNEQLKQQMSDLLDKHFDDRYLLWLLQEVCLDQQIEEVFPRIVFPEGDGNETR